jgi:hypothetical protein
MSWLFSRVLVVDCLEHSNSVSKHSVLWNWTGTADVFLHSDKMSDSYEIHSRFGMTFVPLTVERGAAELIWSLGDFLAKRSAQRQEGAILPMTFGGKCEESWQMSLPGTSSPKTSAPKPLKPLGTNCPRWVSKPKCFPYLRQTWAQTTYGNGIGYLHTPTTKANYAAKSMQKWPSARAFVEVFGVVNPENQEWLMGFPPGWSDMKPLETGKFQLWQQQLCGHLQTLDARQLLDDRHP